MRVQSFLCLLAATFLAGCAHEGVIVQKDTRPSPFYHSLGIDGSYAFLLRDRAGVTHRQIVTPDVYSRYVVGDYFNDLQPGPSGDRGDGKEMKAVAGHARSSMPIAKAQKRKAPRSLASKVPSKSKASSKRLTAAKQKNKIIAARRASAVTLARVARTPTAPKPARAVIQPPVVTKAVIIPPNAEAAFVFKTVARCR